VASAKRRWNRTPLVFPPLSPPLSEIPLAPILWDPSVSGNFRPAWPSSSLFPGIFSLCPPSPPLCPRGASGKFSYWTTRHGKGHSPLVPKPDSSFNPSFSGADPAVESVKPRRLEFLPFFFFHLGPFLLSYFFFPVPFSRGTPFFSRYYPFFCAAFFFFGARLGVLFPVFSPPFLSSLLGLPPPLGPFLSRSPVGVTLPKPDSIGYEAGYAMGFPFFFTASSRCSNVPAFIGENYLLEGGRGPSGFFFPRPSFFSPSLFFRTFSFSSDRPPNEVTRGGAGFSTLIFRFF